MKKLIIFTDLDGTLLDCSNYSFEAALPALQLIKEKDVPLVICSSKTRKEIEHYRKKLRNDHPFISENGGGIFIPKGYFRFIIKNSKLKIKEKDNYIIIKLGAKYSDLRKAMEKLRAEGFNVKGFGDMTVEEIASLTKLNREEVEMAKERDFDEPFVFDGMRHELHMLIDAIEKKGLNYTQGQFHHILGSSDKGKAVSILIDFYTREFGEMSTIAIGDSPNDIPMLEAVDCPIIVQKPDGTYDPQINLPGLIKASDIGPAGWNEAVLRLAAHL